MTNNNSESNNVPHEYENEIRFAVVMYGGISLAIYINGVSQELFRMVRATSGIDESELDPVEKIYRELGITLKTKFVVDVLSGTSAGGINAVYLSKALVDKHKDLSLIERVWLDHADIGVLIDDATSAEEYPELTKSTRPSSLLNNQVFYYRLLSALHEMEKRKPTAPSIPLVDELDLYITATNLAGDPITREIQNTRFDELQFKSVFHFQFEGHEDWDHDFLQKHNPFLAFAARCTAAIPPAFEPMNLKDIEDVIHLPRFNGEYKWKGNATKEDRWNRQTTPSNLKNAYYGDGGYLDNKPFSYAMQDLYRPESGRQVDRKLIYVEPHPEHLKTPSGDRPDLIDNLLKATVILPRYETIQEDIDRIEVRNRVAEIIRGIADTKVNGAGGEQRGIDGILLGTTQRNKGVVKAFHFTFGGNEFASKNLLELAKDRGVSYYQYILIRVQSVIEDISNLVIRVRKAKNGSLEAKGIQESVKEFITENYLSELDGNTFSRFLVEHDYQWHLRRLQFFIHKLEEVRRSGQYKPIRRASSILYHDVVKELPRTIARNSREYKLLCGTENGDFEWKADFKVELKADIETFKLNYQKVYHEYRQFLEGGIIADDDPLRTRICESVSGDGSLKVEHSLKVMMDFLRGLSTQLFQQLEFAKFFQPLTADAAGAERLFVRYFHGYFEALDMLTFPIYYTNRINVDRIDQPDAIEVIRVSPEDGENIEKVGDASKKLAGTRIAHFGGFFKKEWRENDILWGRLDAAEILIKTVVKRGTRTLLEPDQVTRFICKAQAEILRGYYERTGSLQTILQASPKPAEAGDGSNGPIQPPAERLRRFPSNALSSLQNMMGLTGSTSNKPSAASSFSNLSKEEQREAENKVILEYHRTHSKVDPNIPTEDTLSLVGRSMGTLGGMIETLADGRRIESRWTRRVSWFLRSVGALVQSRASQLTVGAFLVSVAISIELVAAIVALLTGSNALKSITVFAVIVTVIVAAIMQLLGQLRTGQPFALGKLGVNLSTVSRIILTPLVAAFLWLIIINLRTAGDKSIEFLRAVASNIQPVVSHPAWNWVATFGWPTTIVGSVILVVLFWGLGRVLKVRPTAPLGMYNLTTSNSATRVRDILEGWYGARNKDEDKQDETSGQSNQTNARRPAYRFFVFSVFISVDFIFALWIPFTLIQVWFRLSRPRFFEFGTEAASSLFLLTIAILVLFVLAMVCDMVENISLVFIRKAYLSYRAAFDVHEVLSEAEKAAKRLPEFRTFLPPGLLRRMRNASLWKYVLYFLGIILSLGGTFILFYTRGLPQWILGLILAAFFLWQLISWIRSLRAEWGIVRGQAKQNE